MGSYTRRTHTMGLPKAIQKEAWSERTYRNRAGAWCPDRRGNLNHPCRLEHRTAHQRSWPPRAEVRNALGTRGSARGGELPHRGRPALGRLVASFSAGKEDGDCPPRPQGSKAPLRGDRRSPVEEGSKRTPLRPPRSGLLRGKIHLPGSLRVDRYFCGHKVRDLQSRRSANRPHRLLDGRRGRPDQRIQGRACRGGGGRLTLCLRAGVGAALLRKQIGPLCSPVAALSERLLPYDPAEVDPLKEVAKIAPRACLFIHGLRDRTCDPEDSVKLYEAAGDPKGLWLLEGAGHCDAYFLDREAYCDRVAAFFEEHL